MNNQNQNRQSKLVKNPARFVQAPFDRLYRHVLSLSKRFLEVSYFYK